MKKRQLYLVLVCTAIAFIGVAATRANQTAFDHYYWINGSNQCELVHQAPECTQPTGISCNPPEFRDRINGMCINELFKNPE